MTAHGHSKVLVPLVMAALGAGVLALPIDLPRAQTCPLPRQHVGLTFPMERIDAEWACRLEPIIGDYTTANKIGPVRTAMPEPIYRYLLDRPPLAAALINRLDLGLYKSEAKGPRRWWGSDGEGTEGLVQLLYQDPVSRVYFLEGTHHSRFLPNVSGKAVVLLRMNAVADGQGFGAVETTLVSYTKVDNRLLSGLLSMMRPLIGSTVTRKLMKGLDVVNRLGVEMRQHPDRVLFEAMDPPAFAPEDVAYLQAALLGTVGSPQKGGQAR